MFASILKFFILFSLPYYYFNSMSEVIEDMEISPPLRVPYYSMANKLSFINSSMNSHISYTQNSLLIMSTSALPESFELLTKTLAKNMQLSLQSYLIKNGEYFVINSSELRKNLYRAFLKTGFQNKMKMTINQQGRICFKMHTFLTKQIQFRHQIESQRAANFIQKIYSQMMQIFSANFEKIKLCLQPIYQKVISENSNRLQRLDIIKNTCRFTYVQPSFMKEDGKRGKINHKNLPEFFVQEDEFNMTNIYDMKVESDQMDEAGKYNLFIQLWQETHVLQKVEDTKLYSNFPLAKIKKMLQNNLKPPQIRKEIPQIQVHEQIFSPVYIHDFEKVNWSKLFEGGFGQLYKGSINFHFYRQNSKEQILLHQKPIQKAVVLKVDKSLNKKMTRIDIQKAILRSLKGYKCQYLPKFYDTNQKMSKFSNFLLIQFYPQRSLQLWLHNFGSFASIFTKLNFLILTCYGLNFLHEKKIIHRDLKLGNILISEKMGLKISDFGQAYHPTLEPLLKEKGRDSRPGFTFPNSPPQIFLKNDKLWKQPSFDMFSLGFIIFEVLFGKALFYDLKEAELKKIYKKQSENITAHQSDIHGRYHSIIKDRIFYAAEQLAHFGPIEILTPMVNVIERCLDPKAANRPHLGWVIGIIKQVYYSLLDFYSL